MWLYERLRERYPSVSLGTVYRNLSLLAEQGKVLVLRGGSGYDRFDGNVADHSHITCTVCGRIADVDCAIPGEAEAEKAAAEASGFMVLSHALSFYGICPECLPTRKSQAAEGKE